MYYTVKKGTETHKAIQAMMDDIAVAREQIKTFTKKVNADSIVLLPPECFCGVQAVRGDYHFNKNWKAQRVKGFDDPWFIPSKKSLYKDEFFALPKVRYSVLSKILKYGIYVSNNSMSIYPGFKIVRDTFYINTPEWCDWKPSKDLLELTVTQFKTQTRDHETIR